MDLLTCSKAKFIEELQLISDTEELKNLLRSLELEDERIENLKKLNKEMTFKETVASAENEKMFLEAIKGHELKMKIKYCQEYLLKFDIKEKVLSSNIKKILNNSERFSEFSWGVIQKKEPEKIFNAIWRYSKNNRKLEDILQVNDCGKFFWQDQLNIDIDNIESYESSISVPVTNQNDKTICDLNDLQAALKDEESHRGDLNFIRVKVGNKSSFTDYIMLMKLDSSLDWNNPELQKFFARTYLSTAFLNLANIFADREECLYGGRIIKNQNGKYEVSFDDAEIIKAVAKANKTVGVARTPKGKTNEKLGIIAKGIQNNWVKKSYKLRETLEEILRNNENLDEER